MMLAKAQHQFFHFFWYTYVYAFIIYVCPFGYCLEPVPTDSYLSEQEWQSCLNYIQTKGKTIFDTGQTYIPKNNELPFPLEKDPKTENIYIHLKETPHGILGEGWNKIAFRTVLLGKAPTVVVCCENKHTSISQEELNILLQVRNIRGLVHIQGYFSRPDNRLVPILEYFNQGSLHDLSKNSLLTLNNRKIFSITMDLLVGLSSLHSLGIFHRDIHTGNILIHQTQNHAKAAWVDFENSWNIHDHPEPFIVFSPSCPPEVILKGNYFINPEKAETYAAGLCLFYLLRGEEVPWNELLHSVSLPLTSRTQRQNLVDSIQNCYEKTRASLHEQGRKKYLMKIILQLLHPDPNQRITLKHAVALINHHKKPVITPS